MIAAILGSKTIVEQTYRSCLGVMATGQRDNRLRGHLPHSVHAHHVTPSYTLAKRLWTSWAPAPYRAPRSLGDAGFVRDASYYAEEEV